MTINRSPADIQADKLPTPLQEYGDRIQTRVRPAPGDRGTEVAVRLKDVPSAASSVPARLTGQDPRQDLRRSLREAKALLIPCHPTVQQALNIWSPARPGSDGLPLRVPLHRRVQLLADWFR
ncbi:hypothetical protein ACFZCT_03275 [Streptomyces qaidamensis]|uniref:hypothetical protein n=1 Tax=Streptomyces qaidamensis TaxID=1783515 RepID=UPI0036E1B844